MAALDTLRDNDLHVIVTYKCVQQAPGPLGNSADKSCQIRTFISPGKILLIPMG